MMKFALFAFLTLLPATLGGSAVQRQLPTALETAWAINSGVLTYDTNSDEFTATFTHGPGLGIADLKIYTVATGTPTLDSPDLACPSMGNALYVTTPTFLESTTFDSFLAGPSSTYKFKLDESVSSWPTVYLPTTVTATENDAIVSFCIYFTLQDNIQDPPIVDVSFLQLGVEITLDLTAKFDTVKSIKTIAADASKDIDGNVIEGFLVDVKPCGASYDGGPYYNNEEIEYCICPDHDKNDMVTRVSSVQTMKMRSDVLSLTQILVLDGFEESSALDISCPSLDLDANLQDCCHVKFILNAAFFPLQDPVSTPIPVRPVKFSGLVFLELDENKNQRHLVRARINDGASRGLTQQGSAEFETDIPIAGTPVEASSAAQAFSFLALAGAVLAL